MAESREVVATYADAEGARRAIRALERHGMDAERIRMIGTPGVDAPKIDAAMREPDMAVTRKVGARGFTTAAVVAIALAAIAAVVAWVVSDGSGTAAWIAAAGGFAFGGPMGFFYGGASALAVSGEWGESFEATGPATIAVHVPEEAVIDVRDRLEATHPTRITLS